MLQYNSFQDVGKVSKRPKLIEDGTSQCNQEYWS